MKNRNLNNHDNWATPKELYDQLHEEFRFDFDPCPLYADFDGLFSSPCLGLPTYEDNLVSIFD